MNLGYMQVEATPANGVGVVRATIYYDSTVDPDVSPQPLINGPRGYALDVTNTTGVTCRVQVTAPVQGELVLSVGQGDPVVNRSRTAAQMKSLGYTNRDDCAGFQISIT